MILAFTLSFRDTKQRTVKHKLDAYYKRCDDRHVEEVKRNRRLAPRHVPQNLLSTCKELRQRLRHHLYAVPQHRFRTGRLGKASGVSPIFSQYWIRIAGDEACMAMRDVKLVNTAYIGDWALGGTATDTSTFARAKRTSPCAFVAKNIELHLCRPVEATRYSIELSYTPPFQRTGKTTSWEGSGCSFGQFWTMDDFMERLLVQVRLKVWALTLGMETEALDSEGFYYLIEFFSQLLSSQNFVRKTNNRIL